MKALFLLLVSVAALFEAFGDVLLKKWSLSGGRAVFFVVGLLVYLVATIIWAFSLKYEFLSKAISVVTVLNLLAVVLVGVFYFKETLSTLNVIGIILAVISIFLIESN
jgi:multidrug transporter EmrE-like cation transporter